jgi:hypothetical protein
MKQRLTIGRVLEIALLSLGLATSVEAQTITHWVTPDGSPTSACVQADPCTLTRAFAMASSGTIVGDAVVLVRNSSAPQRSFYSQAALTLAGGGSLGHPITFVFEPGAVITGTRLCPSPESWSLVPGLQRTYQMAHNRAGAFNSSNPAQRNTTNWLPITVANNAATDKRIDLDAPVRYRNANSISEVEAQGGSHYDTPMTVYVQTFDGQAPSAAHDLCLSSTGWGTVTIQGDYYVFVNLQMQHSQKSGANGLEITNSSDGVVFHGCDLWGTGITGRGKGTRYNDCRVGGVILQGPSTGSQCYNPHAWAVGLCFNAQGSGSAVDLGIQGSSASYGQVWRRGRVYKSRNGMSLMGPNAVEDSVFDGFPNHTFSASGNGGIVRRNVMCNGQDSMYLEGNNFDNLTVENNLACNGVLFWVSRDGRGGVAPTKWRLAGNIMPSLVYDDKTFQNVEADCNVFIRPPADPDTDLLRVTGTDGFRQVSYKTLALWQALNPTRDGSSIELPAAHWTNGAQFRQFTNNSTWFDFHPAAGAQALPLAVCGTHAGPYASGQ